MFKISAVGLMLPGSYPTSAMIAMYPEAPACPVLAQSSATTRKAMQISSVCMSIIAYASREVGATVSHLSNSLKVRVWGRTNVRMFVTA
jgi:hypothetical protein